MKARGRGRFAPRLTRQVRLMLVSQCVWLILLLGFFAWWSRLLSRQGLRIAELETATGISEAVVTANLEKLDRIIFWEAGTMALLVIAISFCILWLFMRDARRSRSVQAFFAGITHELRTPMTGIRLQAESIAEKTADDAPQRKLVDRLLEDTGQLESHLEQTLELARVEGGGAAQLQPINLHEFLQRFLDDWYSAHGADNPKVRYEMGSTVCMADPVAMQTIFRNLFDNTLKHSGKKDVRVRLHAARQGQRISLSYADNGQGFTQDPEELAGVFAKGLSSSGSGVGLYLISALMKQMGGRVSFSSQDGFNAELDFPAAAKRKESRGEH